MINAPAIQVCANGAVPTNCLPVQLRKLEGVTEDLRACADLGAREFHVHPRNAAGFEALDHETVAVWVSTLREAIPGCTISLSTGEWIAPLETRLSQIRSWISLPDYASVNFHETGADAVADALISRGVGIEAGIWNLDGAARFRAYRWHRFCRRLLIEVPDAPQRAAEQAATSLLSALGPSTADHEILIHGEGQSAWPMLRAAMDRGFMGRIGIEDARQLPDGRKAETNAKMVDAALRQTHLQFHAEL